MRSTNTKIVLIFLVLPWVLSKIRIKVKLTLMEMLMLKLTKMEKKEEIKELLIQIKMEKELINEIFKILVAIVKLN